MKFYKVKPEFDNWKLSRDFEIFVANELMTEREYMAALKKYANRNNTRRENLPPSHCDKVLFAQKFDVVEIPKNKTYWFFGARFEMEGAHNEQ